MSGGEGAGEEEVAGATAGDPEIRSRSERTAVSSPAAAAVEVVVVFAAPSESGGGGEVLLTGAAAQEEEDAFFLPFGDGRRACPGARMAMNDMFLVTARLLQRTSEISVPAAAAGENDLAALMRGDTSRAGVLAPTPFAARLQLTDSRATD